ncbi:MAG: cation diffusion facilitator family transporter [Endomicrobia bacterium]|nr:cation diffusion facilitator family transporter [Endomicrobiia bacterium]
MKINFNNDKNCTIIGLIVNFFLVLIKFIAGIVGKSQTMIADALHSLSDGIATMTVYFSLSFSQKPPDENHPYGHGNIEVLTATFVAILMLLTGIFLGHAAIHTIIHKHYTTPENITIYIALLSIIIKELLYRYTFFVGKNMNSPMLIANAYDHRSDAFSSVGALIAITATKLNLKIMDAVGSIIISIFILKMAVDILKENTSIIMNASPPEKTQNEINQIISSVKGVYRSQSTKIHRVGRCLYIETEIYVDKELTLQEAHKIAEEVKNVLKAYNSQIKDISVHVEPYI